MKFNKLMTVATVLAAFASTNAFAAAANDESTASFTLSGIVPTMFSVSARGLPGELDLGPLAKVKARPVAIIKLKYNETIASLIMSSDTDSGQIENGGAAIPAAAFTDGGPDLKAGAGCSTIDVGKLDGATPLVKGPAPLGLDVLAAAQTFGEEDCTLFVDWVRANSVIKGGSYMMNVTITMVGP